MNKLELFAEPGQQAARYTRMLNAPRELVFKAYTDPALITQWWGPRRYTTVVEQLEPRFGGTWRYQQRDAEGKEYFFRGVFHLVKAPEMIVSTFEYEGTPGHVSLETVTLERRDGSTMLSGISVFQSTADRDAMMQAGMQEGFAESMDRLEELLATARV